jgi:hypothetical protein
LQILSTKITHTSILRADATLRAALAGLSFDVLQNFAEGAGIKLVLRRHVGPPTKLRRALKGRKVLALNDGRTISIGLAPTFHQIWAAAHCLAHILQWRSPTKSHYSNKFKVGALEARYWSHIPLSNLQGTRFRRALRQEFEAHLLTASILVACYGDERRLPFEAASMTKAYADLHWLGMSSDSGFPAQRSILRELKEFCDEQGEAPTLARVPRNRPMQRTNKMIPYLVVP